MAADSVPDSFLVHSGREITGKDVTAKKRFEQDLTLFEQQAKWSENDSLII